MLQTVANDTFGEASIKKPGNPGFLSIKAMLNFFN